MAKIYLLPVVGTGYLQAPGGVMGGHPIEDSTHRSQVQSKIQIGSWGVDPATGNIYMYVQAGASIAVKSACTINTSGLGLNDVRATSALQQLVIGAADTSFNSGDFGWVLTDGITNVLVAAATAAGSLLVSGAVAGTLQLAAATDLVSRGIYSTTAEGGNGFTAAYLS